MSAGLASGRPRQETDDIGCLRGIALAAALSAPLWGLGWWAARAWGLW